MNGNRVKRLGSACWQIVKLSTLFHHLQMGCQAAHDFKVPRGRQKYSHASPAYQRMSFIIALRLATFDHKETQDYGLSASDCSKGVRPVPAAARLACT